MADALNKYAPIQSGIMLTIHAYRLPTIGVSPYENPVAKIMAKVNILLTKLAAANSFVL